MSFDLAGTESGFALLNKPLGPVSLHRNPPEFTISGTKASMISVNYERHLVHLGPTNLEAALSLDEPVSSIGNTEW